MPESLLYLVAFKRSGIKEIHPFTYDDDMKKYCGNLSAIINIGKRDRKYSYHFSALITELEPDQSKYINGSDEEVLEGFYKTVVRAKENEEKSREADRKYYGEEPVAKK